MTHEAISHWREVLGITVGMSRSEALEKFQEWQANKKTCARCEGEKYFNPCPVHLICEAALIAEKEVENEPGGEVDIRSRFDENIELEEVGLG